MPTGRVSSLPYHGRQLVRRFSRVRRLQMLTLGTGLAQVFVGGTLANMVGRLWALRISILLMCIGVYATQEPPHTTSER